MPMVTRPSWLGFTWVRLWRFRVPFSKPYQVAAFVLVTILMLGSVATAQEKILPRALYRRAQNALLIGDFHTAYRDFGTYVKEYEASPARGAALLGAAKAAVYSGHSAQAIKYCEYYIAAYPDRPARAMAYLYMGHAQAAHQQPKTAIHTYARGFEITRDRGLRFTFQTVVERLAGKLDSETAGEVVSLNLPPELAARAWATVAEGLVASGQRYRAMQYYARISERYPDDAAGIAARVRQRELEKILAETVRMGLLVPLTGSLASYGKEILRGVELAAKLYTDSTGRSVNLLIEDTEGNAVIATRACQELLQRDPLAVIGPLTSNSAVGCAAATAARGVPLVLPAATDAGLSSLGDAVYCMSPSVRTYGQTLGRYAVEGLGLCSHLVVAPNDEYGYEIAAAYREAVEASGGTIWHETFYEPGTTDFGPHMRAFKSSFLDTLTDTAWFYAPDSTLYEDEEITLYPDAVFTPGYSDDLALLLPQIRFYKIAGRFLGTDSFADEELRSRIGIQLEESVFGSVHPLGEGLLPWEQFSSRYTRAYGTSPGRMAALGYDAFRLVSGVLTEKGATPNDLSAYLRNLVGFEGATGQLTFGSRGSNLSVPVYYIRDRQIAPALR